MSKHESFDGFAVTQYDGKFSGSFDLEDADARSISLDDMVTLVVVGRVSGASHSETKVGDIKRTNVFKVSDVRLLSPKQASEVSDLLENGPTIQPPSPATLGLTDDLNEVSEAPLPEFRPEVEPTAEPTRVDTDPVLARFLDVN